MIPQVLKPIARQLYRPFHTAMTERMVSRRVTASHGAAYNFDKCRRTALSFLRSMQMDEQGIQYRYSAECSQPTLYSSAYACMTYSLLGELQAIPNDKKAKWIAYFDAMQNPKTGLFSDPAVMNDFFDESDWWGARHLALHMISAYTALGECPRYPFRFLDPFKDVNRLSAWLDAHDWSATVGYEQDIDNKIMNVGCLLQYQRDQWNDAGAGAAVNYLQNYLLGKTNADTGLWGTYDPDNPVQVSRAVQFAFHVLPILLYDGKKGFSVDRLLEAALSTQNRYGGFAPVPNSSACEDIDSIYILSRLCPFAPQYRKEVLSALMRAQEWVGLNQVDDGGFVFRLNEGMTYGHRQMMSRRNRGAMFPTWFRMLSLAYCESMLGNNRFTLVGGPGLVCS